MFFKCARDRALSGNISLMNQKIKDCDFEIQVMEEELERLRSKRQKYTKTKTEYEDQLYAIAPYYRPPPNGVDLTLTLPPEILAMILNLVDNERKLFTVYTVCRLWKRVCKERVLVDLNLQRFAGVTDTSLALLAGRFLGAFSLRIGYHNAVSVQGARAVVSSHLRKIHLNYLHEEWDLAGFLDYVSLHCPALHCLDLDETTSVTDEAIGTIVSRCTKLRALSLLGCANVTELVFDKISAACAELEELQYGCDDESDEVSDTQLEKLSTGCPLLKRLDVIGSFVTDNGVGHVVTNLRKLQHLSLNCDVSGSGFEKIAPDNEFQSLGILNSELSGTALRTIATRCLNLRKLRLDLYHSTNVLDADLEKIAACKLLETLSLSEIPNITIASLHHIIAMCHNLTTLELHECQGVVDEEFQKLKSKHQHLTMVKW